MDAYKNNSKLGVSAKAAKAAIQTDHVVTQPEPEFQFNFDSKQEGDTYYKALNQIIMLLTHKILF